MQVYPPLWPTTSTSAVNTFTVTVTMTAPLMTKEQKRAHETEQRRLARIQKWYNAAMKRADQWFAAELEKIEADSLANAWRPHVSHSTNEYNISFWTLGRYNQGEGPKWKTFQKRYDEGFCGLTVNECSEYEKQEIKRFLKSIGKANYTKENLEDYDESDKLIGSYNRTCAGYWFRNLDQHNEFVDLLLSIPERKHTIVFKRQVSSLSQADQDIINEILSKTNYRIINGSRGSLISTADLPGTGDMALIRFILTGSHKMTIQHQRLT